LRRHVDDAAGTVAQGGTRKLAETGVVTLQLGLNTHDDVVGKQLIAAHCLEARPQGLPVAQYLLGGRGAGAFGESCVPEQVIMRGDDVLDGRTVLGLLHAQGIDEDALSRDGGGHAFQFGQLAAGQSEFLEDRRRLKALGN
jgi:hypothetical protein